MGWKKTKNLLRLFSSSFTTVGLKDALFYVVKINIFALLINVIVHFSVSKIIVNAILSWLVLNIPLWHTNYGIILILFTFFSGVVAYTPCSKMCIRYIRTTNNIPDNIITSILFTAVLFILYINFLNLDYIDSIKWERLQNLIFPYFVTFFIAFAVIYFAHLICLIVVKLKPLKKVLNKRGVVNFDQDISDEPITTESEDILDRGDFVNEFHSQIANLPFNSPFVFALQGEWGEGKTSIINLLTNKLDRSPDHIVFKFDPWFFENENTLIKMFMRDLGIVISNNYILPSLRKTFSKYGRLLLTPLDKYLPLKSDVLYSLFTEETLDDVKKDLIEKLARLDKKIIVVIDNIDRLQNDEILATFKLIKLVGNFPNTIFILSFDKNVVNQTLNSSIGRDGEYLEKIVQKTFQLPKPDQKTLDDYLGGYLDNLIENSEIPQNEKDAIVKDFQIFYGDELINVFSTLRKIKTYQNGLRASVSSYIKSEISLFDVLLLETIKVFYADVYADLWKNRWYYMSYDWNFESTKGSPFSVIVKDDQLNTEIKNHIDQLIEHYLQKDRIIIRAILAKLFLPVEKAYNKQNYSFEGMAREYRTSRRVCHPEIFKKYFIHNITKSEFFDSDVRTIIKTANQFDDDVVGLKNYINSIFDKFKSENKFVELIKKLDLFIDDISLKIAESLIKSIYIYANTKLGVKELSDLGYESLYHRFFALMFTVLDKKVDKKRILPLIKDIVRNAPVYFSLMATTWATSSNEASFYQVKTNIDKDKLIKLLNTRLNKYYVDPELNIFKMNRKMSGFILRKWAVLSSESKKIVNKYAFKLINKNHSYVGRIIDGFMVRWSDEQAQIEYDDLQSIYDVEKLYKLTKDLPTDLYINKSEKGVIEIFNKVYEDRKNKATIAITPAP
jgi:hypothetical protein